MVKKFISYYSNHKKLFILDLLCAFALALCDLVYPMITREIINNVVPNKNLRLLIIFGISLLVIYILKYIFNFFVQYWGHVVGVRMQAEMREDVFTHLQKLPLGYFSDNKTGVIMSRIINDLMDISELAHHGPEDLFISLITLVGSFFILCTINVPLTIIIFLLLPLLIWFTIKKRKRMSAAFMETRVQTGEINASLENSISGIRVVKAFTNSDYELEKFKKNNVLFIKARSFAYKTMAEFYSGMYFLLDLLNLVALIAGGYFAYKGVINFGDFAAYFLYISMFLNPIKRLIGFVEQFQSGATGFKRFIELIEEECEKDNPNGLELSNVQGDIRFNNVSFKYDDENHILDNISFTIEKGSTVALVGPSGGGKTTICNLIPRFYFTTEGTISIDNIDINNIKLASLRSNIGIVQQDVFLFTGTIKENICYGSPNASLEDIIEAAKKANIHDFILGLENGYDTFIGERGVKLSGGQKQRLSIARVFLKNPPILILDEATSALDNTTELIIQKSLEKLSEGRTTIIVAHRLSTIKNADKIMVLTDEGISESGTHEDLLHQNGIYAELYNSQFAIH